MKKLTIEEVKERINQSQNSNYKRFIKDAIDSPSCSFYLQGNNIVIVKEISKMQSLNENCIGLYMSIRETENLCLIWSATDDSYGLRDGIAIGGCYLDESFSQVVVDSIKEAARCNECKEIVGYENIHRVGFAGKCCTNCLPKAKEKYEYAGWNH